MSTNCEVGDTVKASNETSESTNEWGYASGFAYGYDGSEPKLSASVESVLERECNHIAEEIVSAALEAATAQVAATNSGKTPLRSSSSQDESPSTSKRVSFSSPTKKGGKENAVSSLTSKLRGLSFRTSSPNKNKTADNKKGEAPEKECYIL